MTTAVVIAGGGPNGLMLAGELRLCGVPSIVLERLPARSDAPKANGLVGQVVRVLDARGLFQGVDGTVAAPTPAPFFMFGGLPLDLRRLEPNPVYTLLLPQRRLEQRLEERAQALGVEIRRGHELTGLSQDEAGVTVEVTGPEGAYRLRTRYVVGCDGAHSTVRKAAGIGFPGVTTAEITSRAAHVVLPATLLAPGTGELDLPVAERLRPFMLHRTARGVFAFASFEGAYTWSAAWNGAGRPSPTTLPLMWPSYARACAGCWAMTCPWRRRRGRGRSCCAGWPVATRGRPTATVSGG